MSDMERFLLDKIDNTPLIFECTHILLIILVNIYIFLVRHFLNMLELFCQSLISTQSLSLYI